MSTQMTRTWTRTTLTAAIVAALPALAFAGQRDNARVKIDASVQIDLSRELRDALREVTAGLGDIVGEVTRDVSRDLGRELGREFGREFGRNAYQNRGDYKASLDDRQTRTVSIGPNGTLELENFSGDITVMAGGGRDVSIDIIRSSHGKTDADARAGLDRVRPEIDVVGTRATVRASYRDRPTSYSVSTDFVVRAPAGTRLVVNSLRADVKVTGIKGDLEITTASGDIVLTDVGTVQDAKTGSGDVVIRGSASDNSLEAGTLSGDITLTDVKARRITGNTVNGSIVARQVECESAALSTISGDVVYAGSLARGGRYEFTSNSGDVRFSPSGSTGYALQATSFTGEISSAVSLQTDSSRSLTGGSRGPRRRAASAKVGDGSASVTLQTFSGDIAIGKK